MCVGGCACGRACLPLRRHGHSIGAAGRAIAGPLAGRRAGASPLPLPAVLLSHAAIDSTARHPESPAVDACVPPQLLRRRQQRAAAAASRAAVTGRHRLSPTCHRPPPAPSQAIHARGAPQLLRRHEHHQRLWAEARVAGGEAAHEARRAGAPVHGRRRRKRPARARAACGEAERRGQGGAACVSLQASVCLAGGQGREQGLGPLPSQRLWPHSRLRNRRPLKFPPPRSSLVNISVLITSTGFVIAVLTRPVRMRLT